MSSPNLAKSDAAVQGLLFALDEQIANMNGARANVEQIRADVASHFMSDDSAPAFLGKVDMWTQEWQGIIGEVGQVMDGLGAANNAINNSNQQALQHANGWSPSVQLGVNGSALFNGLTS